MTAGSGEYESSSHRSGGGASSKSDRVSRGGGVLTFEDRGGGSGGERACVSLNGVGCGSKVDPLALERDDTRVELAGVAVGVSWSVGSSPE